MADGDLMENGLREQTSSADKFWGWSTIWDRENAANKAPMMTRIWIGRLRLHIFWRGDGDPDCHDHPWDFWTFPLTPYVEEVAHYQRDTITPGEPEPPKRYWKTKEIVRPWRWTFRPAEYTHRVLGRLDTKSPGFSRSKNWDKVQFNELTIRHVDKPIITLVWRSPSKRKWGFLKQRDGRWCWVAWREYVFGGGKGAPCDEG